MAKKDILTLPAVLAALSLCSGCFTMATATNDSLKRSHHSGMSGTPVEHIVVSNYGWYLFNCIPLVCGNAKKGASFPWTFFKDEVTSDIVQNRLTDYAARKGKNLAELNLYINDNVLFEVPGTSIPIPMPYVLCYHERLVSALLMEPPKAPPQEQVPEQIPVNRDKNEIKQLLNSIPDGGVK